MLQQLKIWQTCKNTFQIIAQLYISVKGQIICVEYTSKQYFVSIKYSENTPTWSISVFNEQTCTTPSAYLSHLRSSMLLILNI